MKKSATKPRNTTGRDPAATLSPEALTWRQHLLDEFEIADSAGLLLLDTAMAAFDRMREAQRIVAAEGSMQKDRFGAVRAHPALAVERDSRAPGCWPRCARCGSTWNRCRPSAGRRDADAMPTVRKFRGHRAQVLGPLEFEHLGTGRDHLLAADGCRLCRDGVLSGRADWQRARAAVRAEFDRLGMPFPPLGAVLWDGEKLPALNPMWRDLHRTLWGMIDDELAALADV